MNISEMKNVKAEVSWRGRDGTNDRVSVEWQDGMNNRYHVWLDHEGEPRVGKWGVAKGTIYKNPPTGVEADRFGTRHLDANAKANRAAVIGAIRMANIDAAFDEFDAAEAAAKAERERKERERVARARLNAAAPRMLATIKSLRHEVAEDSEIAAELDAMIALAEGGESDA